MQAVRVWRERELIDAGQCGAIAVVVAIMLGK